MAKPTTPASPTEEEQDASPEARRRPQATPPKRKRVEWETIAKKALGGGIPGVQD
jgi:hypothetical protein